MAFAMSAAASRFALLADDVSDPFVKKQPKSQNSTSSKGKSGTSSVPQQKTKKKSQASSKPNKSGGGASDTLPKANSTNSSKSADSQTQNPNALWKEWEKRDNEFVNGTFESELEEAILLSKLEFQKEKGTQPNAATKHGSKSKKKKVTVPLTQFNEMLSSDGNHGVLNTEISSKNAMEDDEVLMERLRIETQAELQREKKLVEEKALLLSRNAKLSALLRRFAKAKAFLNGNLIQESEVSGEGDATKDERDHIVSQLLLEKQSVEEELERCKTRFKKLLDLLADSQLKEKVHLVRDIERLSASNQELSKINEDLNDELKNVYSQLEQERSKSHAALMEVKKITELSKRREKSHAEA